MISLKLFIKRVMSFVRLLYGAYVFYEQVEPTTRQSSTCNNNNNNNNRMLLASFWLLSLTRYEVRSTDCSGPSNQGKIRVA